jgi:acyl-coenzyme A thioesterase PaaI-like protein
MAPTAPPSRTLHDYQRMQRWPWGKWRFARAAGRRNPMLTTLRAQFQDLRVGLCRAVMKAHRRVCTIDGVIDPVAIGALAQLSASMLIEVSAPAGLHWASRGLTIEYLQSTNVDESAIALARLDKVDWGQAGLVGVPVTVSDVEGKEVARAVVSFAVAAHND